MATAWCAGPVLLGLKFIGRFRQERSLDVGPFATAGRERQALLKASASRRMQPMCAGSDMRRWASCEREPEAVRRRAQVCGCGTQPASGCGHVRAGRSYRVRRASKRWAAHKAVCRPAAPTAAAPALSSARAGSSVHPSAGCRSRTGLERIRVIKNA